MYVIMYLKAVGVCNYVPERYGVHVIMYLKDMGVYNYVSERCRGDRDVNIGVT